MDESTVTSGLSGLSSLGDNGTLIAIGGFLLGFWVLRKVIKIFLLVSFIAALIYYFQVSGG